jgi:hypothetical protein
MRSGAGLAVPRALRPAFLLPVLLAALAPLLAGCAAPKEKEQDPLFGLCPQWMQGPGEDRVAVDLNASSSPEARTVFPSDAGLLRSEFRGRSLDLYRLRVDSIEVSGGTLEMRAFANRTEEQKAIRDYRLEDAQLRPVVRLVSSDAGREFDVALTPISQETAPAPDALRLAWTFTGEGQAHLEGVVTYHYRVCGADL